MNLLLIDYIKKPNFRLDLLIPNYRILKKVRKSTSSPFLLTQLSQDNLMIVEEKEIFPILMDLITLVFRQTMKLFIQQIKKERIPQKMLISQSISKFIDEQLKPWHKNDLLKQIIDKIKAQLIEDLNVFIYALTSIQNYYSSFFQTRFFELVEKQNILNTIVNINWFVQDLEEEILDFIKYTIETTKGLTYDFILNVQTFKYLFQENKPIIKEIIHTVNNAMASLYVDCQNQLQSEIPLFSKRTDDCVIMNKYLMVGLIQELSACTYDIADSFLQYSLFYYSQQDVRDEFCRFIVNYFDHMDLIADETPVQNKIYELSDIQAILTKRIKAGIKIITHQIMRKSDRRRGILFETVDHEEQNYIIHKEDDRIIITNAKLVANRWTFIQIQKQENQEKVVITKQDLQQEYTSIQNALEGNEFQEEYANMQIHQNYDEGLSLATQQAQQNVTQQEFSNEIQRSIQNMQMQTIRPAEFQGAFVVVTAAGDIGQSLGQCLANINRYTSRKAFLIDFGETAMINGSMTLIVLQMPLIGRLIAVGGLGYFSMRIYKNKTSSKGSKLRQFNKLFIGTSASLGSSIGGAMLGQALIPVPILGAFIGGVIGGLVGGVSTNNLFDYMNDKKTIQIISEIESQIHQDHWSNLELLNQIGISPNYFQEVCPSSLKYDQMRDIKWFNMVILVISQNQIIHAFLTVYYTQKEQKEREEIIKKRKEERKKALEAKQKFQKQSMRDLSENQNKQEQFAHQQPLQTVPDLDQQQILQKKELAKQKSRSEIYLDKNEMNKNLDDQIIETPLEEPTRKKSRMKTEQEEQESAKDKFESNSKIESEFSDESDEDQANEDAKEWPQCIEKSAKWLLKERVIQQGALPNLAKIVQSIISNL